MDNTAPSETSAPDRRRFLRTLGAGGVASALAVAIGSSKADARQSTPPDTNAAATGGNAGQAGGSGSGEGSGSNGSNGNQSGATPNSTSQDGSGSTVAGTTPSSVNGGAGAGATTAGTSPAASTTTTIAAPKLPTADDLKLLGFTLQYELAISRAYDAVISRLDAASLTLDAALVPVVRVFRQHHLAYGQALSALIGKTAPSGANQAILQSIIGPFQSGAAADFLKAAAVVENTAVATHLTSLGKLASTDAATLVASIIPIEARHATVFELAAKSKDLIPTSGSESLSLALDPSKYPA